MISASWADKLDHVYLAPQGAAAAGGYPGDISAPLPNAPPPPKFIPIVSYHNQPNVGDGSYSFSYETGNGIKAQESGVLKNEVPDGPGEAVQGIYTYTGPDGVVYTVAYTADENGFVAKGDHLPTPPPIPAEILAALQQNAAEEATATPPTVYAANPVAVSSPGNIKPILSTF
ncbi:hypothetical protein J6590_000613 [Homalodisca vitripennis]|nr:hypothetical protein J6590_000613 [Homalodisca vitripennis]